MQSSVALALQRYSVLGGLSGTPVSQSAAGRTLDALRQRIITLELPPETVLSRIELARHYDVSQTPLREALQKLEAEGLVDIYPQSRTVVTRIDTSKMHEAHFLRLAIESEVLRRLSQECDATSLSRLKVILILQEELSGSLEELPAFQELDEVFHQTMMAAAGQPGLHALLRSRSGHLNRVRRLDLPNEGKIRRILDGHRAIIAAIEAKDEATALAAIRDHLSQTVSRVEALRAKHPSYFKS